MRSGVDRGVCRRVGVAAETLLDIPTRFGRKVATRLTAPYSTPRMVRLWPDTSPLSEHQGPNRMIIRDIRDQSFPKSARCWKSLQQPAHILYADVADFFCETHLR